MKIPNKIILEALLLIALLYVSYYLYRLGINMRADMPIIKGEVVDTDNNASASSTLDILATSTLNNATNSNVLDATLASNTIMSASNTPIR